MSGYFPAQHGVKYTLETEHARSRIPAGRTRDSASRTPPRSSRPPATPPSTRASSTASSRPTARRWVPNDVNKYGFTRWDPPDAGANQTISEEGGGSYDNDGRFMNSQGTAADGHRRRAPVPRARRPRRAAVLHGRLARQPPRRAASTRRTTPNGGYDDIWLTGEIDPPATANEDLSTKPSRPGAVPADLSTPPGRSRRRR